MNVDSVLHEPSVSLLLVWISESIRKTDF